MTSDWHGPIFGENDWSSDLWRLKSTGSNLSQSHTYAAQSKKSWPHKSSSQTHSHVIAIEKDIAGSRLQFSWIPSDIPSIQQVSTKSHVPFCHSPNPPKLSWHRRVGVLKDDDFFQGSLSRSAKHRGNWREQPASWIQCGVRHPIGDACIQHEWLRTGSSN